MLYTAVRSSCQLSLASLILSSSLLFLLLSFLSFRSFFAIDLMTDSASALHTAAPPSAFSFIDSRCTLFVIYLFHLPLAISSSFWVGFPSLSFLSAFLLLFILLLVECSLIWCQSRFIHVCHFLIHFHNQLALFSHFSLCFAFSALLLSPFLFCLLSVVFSLSFILCCVSWLFVPNSLS